MERPLSADLLRKMNAYWRAANYLSVGQIYLLDNPLLQEPLQLEHIKPRLLGHWGTTPGLNFIYVHMNRAIKEHDLNAIYVTGPGHGGPGLVANTYLEGTYSEVYPDISPDEEGMKRLFKQFSFPGGIPSHVAPGDARVDPRGRRTRLLPLARLRRRLRQPRPVRLLRRRRRRGGDRARWRRVGIPTSFSTRSRDGAVLPILHLNGYKIAGPTVLARISHEELDQLFRGYGYNPYFVEGDDPATMHQLMAATLDTVAAEIGDIQADARTNGFKRTAALADDRPAVAEGLDRPQGGGRQADGRLRSARIRSRSRIWPRNPSTSSARTWMRSYQPEELFDDTAG